MNEHFERVDIEDPDLLSITRLRHIERYKLASRFVQDQDVVLDIACGFGYGALELSKKAKMVVGVDSDYDSVAESNKKYEHFGLYFINGTAENLPFDNGVFDKVVCIETIEHIEKVESFLESANKLLKSGGLLIVSTPHANNTLSRDGVPFSEFHIREFKPDEIENLLSQYGFKLHKTYGQYIILGSVMCLLGNRINPVSRVRAGRLQLIIEEMPLFAYVFSRHYPFLRNTAKNVFYVAEKV